MAFVLTSVLAMDPRAVAFENQNGMEDIYPDAAFEVLGHIEGVRFETYGVVWVLEGDQPAAFIDEEFEVYARDSFPKKFTDEHNRMLSATLMRCYKREKIKFPYTIWN